MAVGRRRRTHKHLPSRVYLRHGAYYFVTHAGRWIRLGTTVTDMYAELGKLATPTDLRTMADVLKRYRLEVLPGKAEKTRRDQGRGLDRLTAVFGRMRPQDIRPQDVYAYRDKRAQRGKNTANKDLELLKHVFVKAIEWGCISVHPARDVRKFGLPKRERYVTDAEYAAVYAGAAPVLQIAMDLALLTGLRRGDLLALTRDSVTDDGLVVQPRKTQRTTGRRLLIEWSPELRAAVDRAKELPPRVRMPLLCTRDGTAYTGNGFSSLWRRAMGRAIKSGAVTARFTFHDLRAKSASDDTLASASARLGHSSPAVTERHYRRAPAKVRPLR